MAIGLSSRTENIGDGLWRWSVWVDGEILGEIAEVVYTLDPSFVMPVRRTSDRASRFGLQDVASSSFTIYASIKLATGVVLRDEAYLRLISEVAAFASRPLKAEKPIILAVDDDEQVLQAVVGDLRRQYMESFAILRANSGPQGLSTLEAVQAQGGEVALIISDQRMPGMNGIEFLSLAVRINPNAKRMLLTAFDDAGVAIAAINAGSVHYYLTKPWDPPETKLYPVVEALLGDWEPNRVVRFIP